MCQCMKIERWYFVIVILFSVFSFLDLEGGFQKATLVIILAGISSLKIPKAFLIRRAALRSILADIPHRSTVSDFQLM